MKYQFLFFILITIVGITACNHPSEKEPATAGGVQTEIPLSFFTAHQTDSLLRSALDSVVKAKVEPPMAYGILGFSKDSAPYMVTIRTAAGAVEMHELWDDVAIIRSGHGVLKTGNEVAGGRKEAGEHSGNWVGGVIQDVTERVLSPGDFVIIPALLAHQYIPNPGDSLTYWTFKVKRPKN
ncbi:MAG TPA: hypothetical protein DIC22_06290 [Chitinophagaceae bacterium]|jgi:hypothetical protein|nr:hypothetical protein [Chitinophagaceae bacterium]